MNKPMESILAQPLSSQTPLDAPVEIPEGITREDVLQAILDFEAGAEHDFGPSKIYDLIYESKRYPPKAVCGLAARRVLGRVLSHSEFKAGEGSKCFRVLRDLGFRIELKPDAATSFLIRLNEHSNSADELGSHYVFTNQVPNHRKLRLGGHVVVDRKTSEGSVLLGYGVLDAAIEMVSADNESVTFGARFEEWYPITPPRVVSADLQRKIRSVPKYNVQHAIRPITQALYQELISQSLEEPICLLGNWKTASEELKSIQQKIAHRGAWATGWDFVIPTELAAHVPFWFYANDGAGRFPVRAKVSEFQTAHGSQDMASPWPDQTDDDARNITRTGWRENQIRKIWLRITQIEPVDPPLMTEDFEPASPWSTRENFLNQNAFGFARRRPSPPRITAAAYTIDHALQRLFTSREGLTQILAGLQRKMNIILQGPPGVGKTFAAREIAYALMGQADDQRIEMVQFHQSYAYEDFVRGWRPTEAGGFQLKEGLFYRFCEDARKRQDDRFVFIIDEINRGNLSKILGELMMLVEPDKRGSRFAIPLTYSKSNEDRFFVPQNVYLIGLMNTADRSLAMVDYALRRRFMFFDLEPAFEASGFTDLLQRRGAPVELIDRIRSRMTSLNQEISQNPHLGRGFRIGHSYFCPGDATVPDEVWYRSIIQWEITPLIEEYWADQPDRVSRLVNELLA